MATMRGVDGGLVLVEAAPHGQASGNGCLGGHRFALRQGGLHGDAKPAALGANRVPEGSLALTTGPLGDR